MVKHIIKKALGVFPRLFWWMINGTAAAALSALRLIIAGRLRIGLSMTPASLALADRQDKSRTGSNAILSDFPNRLKR